MLVPLAIINHYKPTRPLRSTSHSTSFIPEGFHERDLALPPRPGMVDLAQFFPLAG